MHQTLLTFPQIRLQRRDAHTDSGKAIYRYPRIQYKVVKGVPMVVGLEEGAKLVVERFLRIKHLDIDGLKFYTDQKNMKSQEFLVGVKNALYQYEFVNPWMALNQKNHVAYVSMTAEEKQQKLQRVLTSNILNFLKGNVDLWWWFCV